MSRKITYFPSNENTTVTPPFPVCRVWSYGSIEIERVIGSMRDANNQKSQVIRTINYDKASKASKARLHRVIANLVNKGEATIDFIYGDLGLGYEVEL